MKQMAIQVFETLNLISYQCTCYVDATSCLQPIFYVQEIQPHRSESNIQVAAKDKLCSGFNFQIIFSCPGYKPLKYGNVIEKLTVSAL